MSSYGYTYCVFIRLISVHKIDHQYSAYVLYTISELPNLDTLPELYTRYTKSSCIVYRYSCISIHENI